LLVIVSSAPGILKAGFKQYDLFGVIIIAIATGLGGCPRIEVVARESGFESDFSMN